MVSATLQEKMAAGVQHANHSFQAAEAALGSGEAWTSKKQEFKDGNWTTHATQRVIESRESIGSLQKLEHDLTAADGFYAKKLDPDKRNQLLNTVTGRIFQVKEHQQRQAEMREMKAERVLTQMDRQAATGVPPPPALQQQWQAALSGTSAAAEFKPRLEHGKRHQTRNREAQPAVIRACGSVAATRCRPAKRLPKVRGWQAGAPRARDVRYSRGDESDRAERTYG